jgi:hypothetical protein
MHQMVSDHPFAAVSLFVCPDDTGAFNYMYINTSTSLDRHADP